MPTVPVFAFLDFSSPLSHVADAALRQLEAEGRIEMHLRALEVYPAPADLPPFDGPEWEEAEALARSAGLPMHRPGRRPRTGKAHEAARFAAQQGRSMEMRAALFAALFRDDRDIGRIDVLVQIATEAGLDPSLSKVTLDIDRFSEQIARESAEARRIGIRDVPTTVIGGGAGARLFHGAQTYASLSAALDTMPADELGQPSTD